MVKTIISVATMARVKENLEKGGKCLECMYFHLGITVSENHCDFGMTKRFMGKGCGMLMNAQEYYDYSKKHIEERERRKRECCA